MKKIKTLCINIINKYNSIPYVSKKGLKLIKNILYTTIIYIYMPDVFLNTTNLNENDKMILMACFVVFSGIMSYVIQNYQWKAPGNGNEPDIVYNIPLEATGPGGITGWKLTLWRIFLALR